MFGAFAAEMLFVDTLCGTGTYKRTLWDSHTNLRCRRDSPTLRFYGAETYEQAINQKF